MDARLVCVLCQHPAESESELDAHIEDEHSFIFKKCDAQSFYDDVDSSMDFGSYWFQIES